MGKGIGYADRSECEVKCPSILVHAVLLPVRRVFFLEKNLACLYCYAGSLVFSEGMIRVCKSKCCQHDGRFRPRWFP